MEAVFLKLLNMSITASYLVIAVIIARLLLKKAPKFITVILWGLVAVRLLCPVSFSSILSLIPSAETVPQDIVYDATPQIHSGITFVNSTVNDNVMPQFYPNATDSVNPLQTISFIASVVWLVGIGLMLLYTVISYTKIYFRVREAVKVDGNIYECDRVESPFILGVIRPRIYLPSDMNDSDREYVIAHEKAHIKRRDHLWKPIGFLLLSVYWFNPVLWVAYILLCRDIELACDEKVIKAAGEESKKSYSDALINCSAPRKMITACPVAFGETGVKGRIKSVLNYKKPAFWVIIIAIVLSIAVSVCFMTNPTTKVTDLKDGRIDYSTVFDDAETILANIGGVQYSISYEEDIKEIKNQFEKIRIKETSVADNDIVEHDTTNWIMLGKYWLGFSKDFSQFCGNIAITSYIPPPYEVANPHAAKKLFDLIKNSESNRINTTLEVGRIKSGSNLKGVTVSVKQISLNVGKPFIELEIKNDSENEYMYGENFSFYYKKDGKWASCLTFKSTKNRDRFFNSVGIILKPNVTNTEAYYLTWYDLSKKGEYRLETDDWWVEFELIKPTNTNNNDSQITDGYIQFYNDSTIEYKTPIAARYAPFDKNDLNTFLYQLENAQWMVNGIVDRNAFYYGGRIFYQSNWIYFGYNEFDKSVVFYNDYFAYVDNEVIELIQKQGKKAQNYNIDLQGLKQKYPQYFDLSTAKGLELYVWEMSENNYRCHLLPGRNLAYNAEDIDLDGGATLVEMQMILSTYEISSGQIAITPYRNPLSSYYYDITEEYADNLRRLFGKDYSLTEPASFYATVLEIYGNNVFYVRPLENEEEYQVADKIEVTAIKVSNNNDRIPITVGDKIVISYDKNNLIYDSTSTIFSVYPVRILDAEIGLCE